MEDTRYFNNDSSLYADRSSATERAEFIKKTYSHLALAILGFIGVEALFLSTPAIVAAGLWFVGGMQWLLLLGGFMFVTNMADNWAQTSTDKNKQYMALALYVVAEAFLFVPLLYIAGSMTGGGALIQQAGLMTAALFTGLTAIAFFSNKDFSFLKSFLTVGFIIAFGLIVAGLLFGFDLGLFFSGAMVLLAVGTILYQTSNIIHKYSTDQYVAASLGLFASFMLLFWYILSILMRMGGD
ncbi:MAG: Bax inhibitor-1/YccA family protein [Chitinophagales bacterium]